MHCELDLEIASSQSDLACARDAASKDRRRISELEASLGEAEARLRKVAPRDEPATGASPAPSSALAFGSASTPRASTAYAQPTPGVSSPSSSGASPVTLRNAAAATSVAFPASGQYPIHQVRPPKKGILIRGLPS